MIQRFIELGEGYSDLYELIEIAQNNKHRLLHMAALHSRKEDQSRTSLVVILQPTHPGKFQPLYICREGIPYPHEKPNQRFDLFMQTAEQLNKTVIQFDVKPSALFAEKELFYQYLIGILRLNHYIPEMQ
ncbi:hypothetical protein JOC78_000162 [Bacillus ectoiniformans]|uniref:DUF7147 family protein n=1 Tax=Bacillus ectoiniformans TaxID=1494429 RepID=UPI0019589158|nr:methylthioribose kinase [Bacillus ectoiniformans]MBM7647241.1 hypothetical protein [Bacillus ectoiniformans]